jgi:hypothetical protein
MLKSRLILGIASVVTVVGIVGLAAEQQAVHPTQHPTMQHSQRTSHDALPGHDAMHSECVAGDATAGTAGKSHVPDHFAQALGLTTAQQSDIDRLSNELCQAINKTHQAMLNVLTPEQRSKIAELHGGQGHGAAGLHALMMKMHGGGK